MRAPNMVVVVTLAIAVLGCGREPNPAADGPTVPQRPSTVPEPAERLAPPAQPSVALRRTLLTTTVVDLTCAIVEQNCGGLCTNAATDVHNCGQCGVNCALGQLCRHGACVAPGPTDVVPVITTQPATMTRCDAGSMDCGEGCVDIVTNVLNCGGCGTTCATGTACVNGSCV